MVFIEFKLLVLRIHRKNSSFPLDDVVRLPKMLSQRILPVVGLRTMLKLIQNLD
jgi:hypothetical protein